MIKSTTQLGGCEFGPADLLLIFVMYSGSEYLIIY